MSSRFDADELAHLEDERSFLLSSLADLEREHAAGDVDQSDYEELRDGYVKRAADVLDEIDRGKAAVPPPRPNRWSRRIAGIVAVALVAAGLGWFVARSAGQRLSNDSLTGDIAGGDRVASLLSEARMNLGTDIDSLLAAGALYNEVLDLDPGNPEALAYGGWVAFLVSRSADLDPETAADAEQAATARLDQAIETDSGYADPLCFRAIVASSVDSDDDAALDFAERCLALDPPAAIESLMAPFIARLDPATTVAESSEPATTAASSETPATTEAS